jgi:hypothetical protein
MASNSKNLAELLNTDSTISTGDIAEGVVTGENIKFPAIDATISDTAVDLFVYDTSKDSDGGAWRNNTETSSWYNESLNTSIRGSRRKFPSVAVIVAEAQKLTIYDGDDPDLPMWMVFNTISGSDHYLGYTTRALGCVTALNGEIVVGNNDTYGYVNRISFIEDIAYYHTDSNYSKANNPISERGSAIKRQQLLGSTGAILNRRINGVAMKVLPNAPINQKTGLLTPTIAVASPDGVSVIKEDNTVVDITHTVSAYNGARSISFGDDNRLHYASQQSGSGQTYWRMVISDVPTSDVTGAYASNLANASNLDARGTTGLEPALNRDADLAAATNDIKDFVPQKAFAFTDKVTLAKESGTRLDGSTQSNQEEIAIAYVTKDYNSGWMPGKIRLAALADIDDTNVSSGTDPDRSRYNSGLTVNGTITKTKVATGADLVSYGGFSSSNYLSQAYTANLAFGSGSYSVMVWFKKSASGWSYLASRGTSDNAESMRIGINEGTGVYFDYGDGSAYTQTNSSIALDVWNHLVCTVYAGSPGRVWINGVEQPYSVNNSAPSTFLDVNTYGLTVGNYYDLNIPWDGELALFRYGATVPSDELIQQIYAEEKELFKENAKCTLYGTSNSVTALAYDKSSDKLHVGTSSGRSVFQGLQRVENTTDAIGTRISVSNGMVAED